MKLVVAVILFDDTDETLLNQICDEYKKAEFVETEMIKFPVTKEDVRMFIQDIRKEKE